MSKYIVIATDGTVSEHDVEPGGNVGLKTLQGHVEGLVDVIEISDKVDAWVNDEGLYTHEPNFTASYAIMRIARSTLDHPIHGPVVFCANDREGSSVALDDETAAEVLGYVNEWNLVSEAVAR
jgi:hypothetical protein